MSISWQWILFCLLFVTGMSVYVPLIFIRKMNKVLQLLEQIEAHTRSGASSKASDQSAS